MLELVINKFKHFYQFHLLVLQSKMSTPTVGIDLGTTHSCVGIYKNGNVEIIADELGNKTMPSCVTYTEGGKIVTGRESVDIAHQYLESTIYDSKRLIGQSFSDPKVQEDINRLPYHVFNDLGTPKIKITLPNGKTKNLYPEEISANILFRMKTIAEARLNTEITKAVITVPAYFNNGQRQATKDAATIAGFKTVHIIHEPTAAAISFNDQNKKLYKRHIVVYDFGGGTFDISIVTINKGKFDVKSTKGDCHLGGIDINMILEKFLMEEIKKLNNNETVGAFDHITLRRLQNACEKAKKKLSKQLSIDIELDNLPGLNYTNIHLTRTRFEQLNADIFEKTFEILKACLREADLTKDDIDAVVLVGGSSRIPKIQEMLKNYFGDAKINKGVNPDEAVAYGAAIHATNLAEDKNEVRDVITLTLSTNKYNDLMSCIFPRNTPIPAKCTKRYQTMTDNQTTMEFPIYQGERDIASENYELGRFLLLNLTDAPAKQIKVEVCYEIDEERLLHVSATEMYINKQIVIDEKKHGLSKEQIQHSIQDVKMYNQK